MRQSQMLILSICLLFLSAIPLYGADTEPNLNILSKSGWIMGPGNEAHPVHRSWRDLHAVMQDVDVYDSVVARLEEILCGNDNNKSALIVGEPVDAFRYVFARMAAKKATMECNGLWHVEVDISAIEAGHSYVGEVDEYWREKVLKPADGKKVILYFRSLGSIVGLGSHSNDSTGIESEMAANITSGRIRAVAFVDKYEYQRLKSTENAYVVNAFSEQIQLSDISKGQIKKLARKYISVLYPNIKVPKSEFKYLLKTLEYYQPNIGEPRRTMTVLQYILRSAKKKTIQFTNHELFPPVEFNKENDLTTPPPEELVFTHDFNFPEATDLQLHFDFLNAAKYGENLTIIDLNTNAKLTKLYGQKEAFLSDWFPSNNIRLRYQYKKDPAYKGFRISKVTLRTVAPYEVKRSEVRKAIFEFIQVPQWLIKRKFKVIQNLESRLNDEVIGFSAGKSAAVREAKIGYVSGRTGKKPVATIFAVGPTGTGKSHLAKSVAKAIDMPLVTMDMTQYHSNESFDRFLTLMAQHLTLNPFAVYLFEEIDKANKAVLDRLYFMMDDGLFYDKFQRPLFARGAYIIMTTNAATNIILEHKDNPLLDTLVNKELQKTFRLSFLNRFNSIAVAKPFTPAQYHKMAANLVAKKKKKIKSRYGWILNVDEATTHFIGHYGKSYIYGSRPIGRLAENIIAGGIADFILEIGDIKSGETLTISLIDEATQMFRITVGTLSLDYKASMDINSGRRNDHTIFALFR